jgi:regulator of CtrA degradation
MTLVEEAAAYLDGPGREESRGLPRPAALAYSTESMRLTTRLMQVASWLLLQRAVNEGELTAHQAQAERVRVKLSREDYGCRRELFEQLPATLQSLSERSLRIQERVMHLDQSLVVAHSRAPVMARSEVASQVERLRAAFSQ